MFTFNLLTDLRLFQSVAAFNYKTNFEYHYKNFYGRAEFGDVINSEATIRKADQSKIGFAYEPEKNFIVGLQQTLGEDYKPSKTEACVFYKPTPRLLGKTKLTYPFAAGFFAKFKLSDQVKLKLYAQVSPNRESISDRIESFGIAVRINS